MSFFLAFLRLGTIGALLLALHGGAAQANPPAITTTLPLGLQAPTAIRAEVPIAAEYGEFLFSSALLSRDQRLSCVSCHVPDLGYSDSHQRAIGAGGAVGRRRAPPLLNLFLSKSFMWDGRADSLAEQIHLPLEAANEMAIDWPVALGRLQDRPETKRFLDAAGQPAITRDLVLKSLAAYVGTLVTEASPFDRYYFGKDETAISDDAKSGFRLFVRKGRCSGCHQVTGFSAPLTDGAFHSTGIGFADGKYDDEGRYEVTKREEDRGAFKTPTLRNAALRPYFMHDGSLKSLREVLDYYNRGGNHGAPNLDGRIQPLYLTGTEITEMLAFLESLNSTVASYRPWLNSMASRP